VVLAEDREHADVVHLGQRGVGGLAQASGLLAQAKRSYEVRL
jgi:hypothetical protein